MSSKSESREGKENWEGRAFFVDVNTWPKGKVNTWPKGKVIPMENLSSRGSTDLWTETEFSVPARVPPSP